MGVGGLSFDIDRFCQKRNIRLTRCFGVSFVIYIPMIGFWSHKYWGVAASILGFKSDAFLRLEWLVYQQMANSRVVNSKLVRHVVVDWFAWSHLEETWLVLILLCERI